MMISFKEYNTAVPKFNRRRIAKWIKKIASINGYSCGEITYYFCDNKQIEKINNEYLQHNYPTDIITFNYNLEKSISGEMFIGIETVNENAEFYNEDKQEELFRVLIHGVLHLIGFDDQTEDDQIKMTSKENEALNYLFKK